jgi:hypothetical protein
MSSLLQSILTVNGQCAPRQVKPRRTSQILTQYLDGHRIDAKGALRRHAEMAADVERQNALKSRPLHFTPQTRRAVYAERKAAA